MTSVPVDPKYLPNVANIISTGQKMLKTDPLKAVAIEPTVMTERLLMLGREGRGLTKDVSENEIMAFLYLAQQLYKNGPSLIEIEPPVNICGDIHGQYGDLLRLFDKGGFPDRSNYLFLGDYVDRGTHNLETILLLLSYALQYPDNCFLLRGNHELLHVNAVYGFYEECQRRYSPRIWLFFQDAFAYMPPVGLVGGRILCMHGGISDKIKSLDQLRKIKRPFYVPEGICTDILWADPLSGIDSTVPSVRGAGVNFGELFVKKFCNDLGIDLIARGHQVVQDGYEFFADRHLVTIFSAPYYQAQYNNAAAMMSVAKDLRCSFIVMKPTNKIVALTQFKEINTNAPVYKTNENIEVKAFMGESLDEVDN